MLDIRDLTKSFGKGDSTVTALHQVNFSIAEGEFFTLLGPSGCGKTTLLRLIAGFEPPSGGSLVLDGQDIAQMPPNRRPVNTVFQNYALFPHMTVAQNVGFALGAQGRPKDEIAQTVARMLDLVQLGHLAHRKSGELWRPSRGSCFWTNRSRRWT
jgi:spermidine/putrescine transport system ATP-binding protein